MLNFMISSQSAHYIDLYHRRSQSFHHPQEVLLAQFSLYVHKGGLKPDSFHFKVTVMLKNVDFLG